MARNIMIIDHDSGSFNSMDQNTHHILVKQWMTHF